MSDYDEILQQIPMDQLASMLGVDEQTASAATQEALPALLGGLQANAADPDGAASLASAPVSYTHLDVYKRQRSNRR